MVVTCQTQKSSKILQCFGNRPLAFEIRPLKGKDLYKPIYEKEMMGILHALRGSVAKHIENFQILNIKVTYILDEHYMEQSISQNWISIQGIIRLE